MNDHNFYLLTIDACTRDNWGFPFLDKKLPVSAVNVFLKKRGKHNGIVRTDKISLYSLEITAPESIFQIGTVERLHQTIAGMMRAMLLGSNLDPDYWSDDMLHVACLESRLPHKSLQK